MIYHQTTFQIEMTTRKNDGESLVKVAAPGCTTSEKKLCEVSRGADNNENANGIRTLQ